MENNILAAIGEALIDFIPDKKGCEFDEVEAFLPKIGGAPANVCGAYVKLGGKAKLFTQLGADPFGKKILGQLNGFGIDTSCVTFTDKANTALAFVSLGTDGSRTFSFYRDPSADMLYSKDNIKEEYFDKVFALHFCSVSLGDFPMKEAHRKAIDIMRKKGGIVSFDPNLRFALWDSREELKKTVNEFIPLVDIVKISDEELEFITGEKDIEKALDRLFTGEVKLVVYTCGSKGAYAFTRNAGVYDGGRKTKAVDTTGAGDGFIGSFLWQLNRLDIGKDDLDSLNEEVLKKCLGFSNEFCARSVEKCGAVDSYPNMKDY